MKTNHHNYRQVVTGIVGWMALVAANVGAQAASDWMAMGSAQPRETIAQINVHQDRLVLSFHLPGFYKTWSQTDNAYQISMPGGFPDQRPGQAKLPFLSYLLTFPGETIQLSQVDYVSKMIFTHTPVAVNSDHPDSQDNGQGAIAKSQPQPLPDKQHQSQPRADLIVNIQYLGKLNSQTIVQVNLLPFYADRLASDLYAAEKFAVTLRFATPLPISGTTRQVAFGRLLSNESDLEPREEECPPEYLIVTPNQFVAALQPLVIWRTAEGMEVTVKTIDEIKKEMQITELLSADKLREYLSLYYNRRPNLNYVLLAGDVEFIPVKYQNDEATDLYYSLLDGSGDFLPDVYLGRFPVNTAQEIGDIVDKIILHEKTAPSRRVLLASYFQDAEFDGIEDRDYIHTSELFRDYLVKRQYTCERAYTKTPGCRPTYYNDYTPVPAAIGFNATSQDIINFINIGAAVINHRDHGDTDGWSQPPFKNEHLSLLTNQRYPLLFNVDCTTGKFDGETCQERRETEGAPLETQQESFSERILALSKRGVVAVVAPTRETTNPINQVFNRGLMSAIWPAMFNISEAPATRLGQMLFRARIQLLREFCPDGIVPEKVLSNFRCYHILGDPALRIRLSQ